MMTAKLTRLRFLTKGVQPLWKLRTATSSYFAASESTIYALATGGVRCALAVIRVSGSGSGEVLKKISKLEKLPQPRKAVYRKLYDPVAKDGSILDHGILLWFPGPSSYTGEDSCEFHVHGGLAVITGVMRAIGSIQGCRVAEPGEFTKRAFLNGKLDLTEVDGLSDLIAAETEMQRIQAVQQLDGALGKLYDSWRARIAKALANLEAYIDFGEDENIETDILESVRMDLIGLREDIRGHLSDKRKGERLRNGARVAIIGKPNVGKSSLLNILCKRDAAIVSHIPGTTRDVIETTVNFHGYPVIFCDTAGIRSATEDVIEAEGVRRSVSQALKADLVLMMIDSSDVEHLRNCDSSAVQQYVTTALSSMFLEELGDQCADRVRELQPKLLVTLNKVDLTIDPFSFPGICSVSCKTNHGIDALMDVLSQRVSSLCADPKSEAAYLTHERYRSHLENCLGHLTSYVDSASEDSALNANILRNAMNSIGNITGHFGTEDILDILFRDFCIGK